MYRILKGQPIEVIGININDEPAQARAFLKQAGLSYPNATDTDNEVARRYEIDLIPAVFLIDKKGVLRYQGNSLPSLPEIGRVLK